MTTAAKNDNASKTPTFDAVLAALSATYTGTDRWVLEGWATHIREARHALHAINSLVQYAAEISDAAWPAAFDLACVERISFEHPGIVDKNVDAAIEFFKRFGRRDERSPPARLAIRPDGFRVEMVLVAMRD